MELTATDWALLPFQIIYFLLQTTVIYLIALYRVFVPNEAKSVKGSVILITGAGGGIGGALAVAFGKLAARLALLDINKEGCDKVAEQIRAAGGVAHSYKCDITNYSEVKAVANDVRRDLGEVDILINNAGVLVVKKITELSEEEIRRTFEVNSISHFWTVKEFLPSMLERNSGHIVTIASMAAVNGVALLTDYCASKWAVRGFSHSIREELRMLKKDGIHVSTVYPMFVLTNLVTSLLDRITVQNRFGKNMSPEEVAEVVVDGVRRNLYHIFIPRHLSSTRFLQPLLPMKAKQLLQDFMGNAFIEKK